MSNDQVSHLQGVERREAPLDAVPQLSRQLKELRPDVVVAVMKSIGPMVQKAIEDAGIECRYYCLPFPGNGWQKVYVGDLAALNSEYGRL